MNATTRMLNFCEKGFSVIPLGPDKRPLGRWEHAMHGAVDVATARGYGDVVAYGIVCGRASRAASPSGAGELLVIDFEFEEEYVAWRREVGSLADGLLVVRTGGGGVHVHVFCPDAGGNDKLAWRRADHNQGREIAIETRANGGYVVGPGSLHPSGNRYELVTGDPSSVPEVTNTVRDVLLAAARNLCRAPLSRQQIQRQHAAKIAGVPRREADGGSVIEQYNRRVHPREVLKRHGYAERGGRMIRPGAESTSVPGVTFFERDGVPVAFAHSTNDVLNDGHAHTSFGVLCKLEYQDDVRATVRAAALELGIARQPDRYEHATPTRFGMAAGGDFKFPDQLEQPAPIRPAFVSVDVLCRDHPKVREPLIDGLIRRGDVANIIAPPKARKSWLAMQLAISTATGRRWLDRFDTVKCPVLMLDNELQTDILAQRLPAVAEAMGVPMADLRDRLFVESFRGNLRDVFGMAPYFAQIRKGQFGLVIVDALYRWLPSSASENDNAMMAATYNKLDCYAQELDAAIVLVHHSSKGNQAEKSIADIGAGAGAQSRAADAHIVLRQHEVDDCMVLDAVVRSFAPVQPLVMRWEFPVWRPDATLDPAKLRTNAKRRERHVTPNTPITPKIQWTPEMFATRFLTAAGQSADVIKINAPQIDPGLSVRKAESLLKAAVDSGFAFKWGGRGGRPALYATKPEPPTQLNTSP